MNIHKRGLDHVEHSEKFDLTVREFVLLGDAYNSGEIDLTDAIIVLKLPAGIDFVDINVVADIDGYEQIGQPELIYILQYCAGLRP